MEMTTRGLWTLVHGMGFGALYLFACSFAIVELYRRYQPDSLSLRDEDDVFLCGWLAAMAVIAWITVLTGAYIVYPWYRAVPPPGITALHAFPQALLKSNSAAIGWHAIGMEWKEHIAWMTPISTTMAASVVFEYRRSLTRHPQLRAAVLAFVFASFAGAGIAGFFGAELNKHAPVEGGATIRLMRGVKP